MPGLITRNVEDVAMKHSRWKATWVGLLCGGVALVTTATCDPTTGRFDFFRNDDSGYYDDGFYDDGYFDGGYYEDEIVFIDDYYYEDEYYYDDCYDCW